MSVSACQPWVADRVSTPAFVVDQQRLLKDARSLGQLARRVGVDLLYPLKAASQQVVAAPLAEAMGALSASSLFEARHARELLGDGHVHFTSPGMRPSDAPEIATLCSSVAFNSLGQLDRHGSEFSKSTSCGLRVNPELSVVRDARYDPCRSGSKLGMPLSQLKRAIVARPDLLDRVDGLQFHSNCESRNLDELLETVHRLVSAVPSLLHSVSWVNLGGGYLLDDEVDTEPLARAAEILRDGFGCRVQFEPGAAVVRGSGCFVCSVVDLFETDGRNIAVVDLSVNHWPEVFEYQFEPDLCGEIAIAGHEYIVSGASCLAGDVFGEYRVARPLRIGSRLVFRDAGAYSLVKAHMFNGINLPTVYCLSACGELSVANRFGYDEYRDRCGASIHATA